MPFLSSCETGNLNITGFLLLYIRSTDGVHYASLGQVASSSSLKYSFTDAMPVSGQNYYRLKMVDKDGQYKLSGIIFIRTNVKGGNISVTPNPFTDHIAITIESNSEEAVHLRIFNSEGKLIWKKTTSIASGVNTQYFNGLQSLPAGVYYIKVNRTASDAEFKLLKR